MFRLVPLKDVFLPNGPDGLPTYEAFRPTRQDEREAEARGRPVLVSVWEHGVTTVEQASTLRRADAERDGRIPGESLPRWLATADIEDASAERLRVLHDPRPEQDGPGAIGHAGIEGLERRRGEQKTEWKAMLDELVARSRRVPPP